MRLRTPRSLLGRMPSARSLLAGLVIAGILADCAVMSWLVADRRINPGGTVSFAASVACVLVALLVTVVAAYLRSGRSALAVVASPLAIAALTWLPLFVARPLELYGSPDHAALSLAQLGFGLDDLTRTTALAALGAATWCAGYLVGLGRARGFEPASGGARPSISGRGAAIAVGAGTLLWVVLFLRQGGPQALAESAASVRYNQGSSFWGFVGVWIVLGAALFAFATRLQRGAGPAGRVAWAGGLLSLAAAAALELRSFVAFGLLAAVLLVLVLRGFRPISLALGACVLAVAVFVLAGAQQVRAYSAAMSTSAAVRLTWKTPVDVVFVSDLSTFDNFAAMQTLIPRSVGYLDGRSVADIPEALVPRALWPRKPLGLDFEIASYLYPGVNVGIPISVQGELFWNFGLPGIAVGAGLIGLLMGLLARAALRTTRGSRPFVLYVALLPLAHSFLTRVFTTSIQNFVFAFLGISIALYALSPDRPSLSLDALRGLRGRRPIWRPWSRRGVAAARAD